MYSLRQRIARNLTANLLVVMIALVLAMYFFAQRLLHDYILTHLQHDAESLASVIYEDRPDGWKIDPGRMSSVYSRVRSGHYYHVEAGSQAIDSRSLFDADFPGVGTRRPSGSDYLADGPGDERWLIWYQQVSRNDQRIGIWVAEDIAPIRFQLWWYLGAIVGLIAIVAAALFYLQRQTLRRAFEVFDWLRANLALVKRKQPLDAGLSMPIEVAPLVAEIEQLVEHLDHRILRTRNAMGNLAHELKRPLQLLSIQQESGAGGEMRDTLAEITRILDRELKRARISGSSATSGDYDLASELDYLAEVLRKIYPDIRVDIDCLHVVASPGLDRDDMLELIGNLFDNACKFARSRARLVVSPVDGNLELRFEDDGSGLEPAQLLQLNRRGQRLDERVAGHGLGLGICRDILDYYRGSLSFARSALGGLEVTVRIPRAWPRDHQGN